MAMVTESTRRSAIERVARWRPKGDLGAGEEAVDFARRLVFGMLSEVEDPKAIGGYLAAALGFARYLTEKGRALSVDELGDDVIGTYVTEALGDRPKGTQHATVSRIRRLRSAAEKNGIAGVMWGEETEGSAPEKSVHWVLEHYVPTKLSLERFDRVAALVREACAACEPKDTSRAELYILYGSYLAAWCDEEGIPLRSDAVFSPRAIEQFLASLEPSMPASSRATISWCLHTMARKLHPELDEARKPVGARALAARSAYSTAEVAALLRRVQAVANPRLRRHLGALLALGLGAGAEPGEASGVRNEDVVADDSGTVWVSFRGSRTRKVAVKEPFAELLAHAAREAAAVGDVYVLGGGTRRRNRSSDLCGRTESWDPPICVHRMRDTYLIELANEPHTVPELLRVAE